MTYITINLTNCPIFMPIIVIVILPIFFRALLLNNGEQGEGFVKSVAKHLVDKLVREKPGSCALLLRGLSVLCECQGAPIKQNQSKSKVALYMQCD